MIAVRVIGSSTTTTSTGSTGRYTGRLTMKTNGTKSLYRRSGLHHRKLKQTHRELERELERQTLDADDAETVAAAPIKQGATVELTCPTVIATDV